jgi:transaldolase
MSPRTTVHSSQFIVGSVDKITGRFSISANPEIHTEYAKALHEAQRLASLYPDKKFIVWAAVAVSQVTGNPITTTYSL